jgi:hypothetical protein
VAGSRKRFHDGGAAVQKLMMKIEHEQEVLMHIADMAIETYKRKRITAIDQTRR